jgi:hypothetical protein
MTFQLVWVIFATVLFSFLLLLYLVVKISDKPQKQNWYYPGKYDMSPTGTIIGRGITFDNEISNLFICTNEIIPSNPHMQFTYKTEKKWIKAAAKCMREHISYDEYVRYELIYEDKDDSFIFWEYTV